MKNPLQLVYESQILAETEYVLATDRDQQTYGGTIGWKGIIVWSTTQKFLSLVASLPLEVIHDPSTQRRIAELAVKIQHGTPMDPFVLITDQGHVTGHEGRHRAYACERLGITKVPILVIPRDLPRVPQWTPEMYAQVRSLNLVKERH